MEYDLNFTILGLKIMVKRRIFAQNYKSSNKNDLICALRDSKKSLWCMINETLSHKFYPYSVLTGLIMVESEGYCVLSKKSMVKLSGPNLVVHQKSNKEFKNQDARRERFQLSR